MENIPKKWNKKIALVHVFCVKIHQTHQAPNRKKRNEMGIHKRQNYAER